MSTAQRPLGEQVIAEFLERTAAKTPTPGGGAAAGATGALACALAGMVVSYSIGKKDLAAHQGTLEAAQAMLASARAEFLALADQDAAAYGALNALQKLPVDDPRRGAELPGAIDGAIAAPLRCLRLSEQVARQCAALIGITNKWLRSDLAIAGVLAGATARASLMNVRVNLPLVENAVKKQTLEREASGLEKHAREHAERAGTLEA